MRRVAVSCIIEQSCGSLSVEMFPGNIAISATILLRGRELSVAHAQRCSFLIMGHCSLPLAVEIFPGEQETLRFQHLFYQDSERSVWRMCRGAVS
jgi:hypothetical protein